MKQTLCVYVDVDDTLVRSAGTKRVPISRVIEHIKLLKHQGAVLYCWSSGGAEYAKESAESLGLGALFAGFLPKPHVMIDDQPLRDWKYFKEIHPTGCDPIGVDAYLKQIFG